MCSSPVISIYIYTHTQKYWAHAKNLVQWNFSWGETKIVKILSAAEKELNETFFYTTAISGLLKENQIAIIFKKRKKKNRDI